MLRSFKDILNSNTHFHSGRDVILCLKNHPITRIIMKKLAKLHLIFRFACMKPFPVTIIGLVLKSSSFSNNLYEFFSRLNANYHPIFEAKFFYLIKNFCFSPWSRSNIFEFKASI